MNTVFYKRLSLIELSIQKVVAAPTLPIYDPTNVPQDAVDAQIFIGTDNSINWFDRFTATWNTYVSTDAIVGNVPQDVIDGQIVIGSDCSLCWYSNGAWHGAPATIATPLNVPQDIIDAQIVIGIDSICWYCNGIWYGLSTS